LVESSIKMHFVLLSCLSVIACARAQILDLPQVDELVREALVPFAAYTHFHGSKQNSSGAIQSVVQSVMQSVSVATVDSPYWLANIAHQGLAAFNSNPATYTVFRNVKDYGAVGE
jgi:glucan 1,3-beta-glucosidase